MMLMLLLSELTRLEVKLSVESDGLHVRALAGNGLEGLFAIGMGAGATQARRSPEQFHQALARAPIIFNDGNFDGHV